MHKSYDNIALKKFPRVNHRARTVFHARIITLTYRNYHKRDNPITHVRTCTREITSFFENSKILLPPEEEIVSKRLWLSPQLTIETLTPFEHGGGRERGGGREFNYLMKAGGTAVRLKRLITDCPVTGYRALPVSVLL